MPLLLLLFFLLLPSKTYAQPALKTFSNNHSNIYAPDRVLVKYKRGQSKSELQRAVNYRKEQAKTTLGKVRQTASDLSTRLTGQRLPEEKLEDINLIEKNFNLQEKQLTEEVVVSENKQDNPINVQATVNEFKKLNEVEEAVPDYRRLPSFAPNDVYYPYQWGLTQIQTPQAWDITQGNQTGDVLIAIIDTGISNSHPDLLSSKVVAYYDCANIVGCIDGGDDLFGHGTIVAGIAGAVTNNLEGVSGTAFNTKLISLKVDDIDGFIYDSYIISALNKLMNTYSGKKVVVNMSLGGPFTDSILESTVNAAWNSGFIIVASAGNCGNNTDPGNPDCNGQTNPIMYPAYYQNVIAVAATNNNDQKASYSEYGSWVDVAAPGGDNCTGLSDCIVSTYPPPDNYALTAGTSMASPFAAGVVGLIWSTNTQLSNSQIRNRLESNTDAVSGTGTFWVYGRVNAYKAVSAGSADVGDLTYLVNKFGTSDINADLNNSGKVNTLDLSVLLFNWGN